MTKENWSEIHVDFKWYQKYWEEQNLTYQDAQEWIQAGFEPNDYWRVKQWKENLTPQEAKTWIEIGLYSWNYKFASYLKQKNIQPHNLPKTIEELKKEYRYQD